MCWFKNTATLTAYTKLKVNKQMYPQNEFYWIAEVCDASPELCEKIISTESATKSLVKIVGLLLFIILTVALTNFSHAQVMPTNPPATTALGGTGASADGLLRIAPLASNTEMLQNLTGPTYGNGRDRQSIHMVSMSEENLPNLEGYFFRSSYVVLSPRGFAPIHSHARRPAYLQVITGNVTQHRSDGISLAMGTGDFTFSSDQLAHWWDNESTDTAMRLWIVELCSSDHGCIEKIEGGALVPTQTKSQTLISGNDVVADETELMVIDLPGEFPNTSGLDNHELRLRKIVVAPNSSIGPISIGEHPTYFRIDQGELVGPGSSGGVTSIPAHSIVYLGSALNGQNWKSSSTEETVLYVVDLLKR